jgi:1-acyl-sn-glycerol-3-phosphate acyltransferase
MKITAMLFYTLTGWKAEGLIPSEIRRCVLVVAPHTSNYDLVFARMAFFLQERPVHYLIKDEYMHSPLRVLLLSIGAIGVDRSRSTNMVNKLVNLMNSTDEFVLAITPEGTRSYSPCWKTGFYQIALKANVPIVLMYLDYRRKAAGVAKTVYPSCNFGADMEVIEDFFKTVQARYPGKYNPVIFKRSETC